MKKIYILLLIVVHGSAYSQSDRDKEVSKFSNSGENQIKVYKSTNTVGFIKFGESNSQSLAPLSDRPLDIIQNFLGNNKTLLSIKNNDNFIVKSDEKDYLGMNQVAMQQLYFNIPVYDGVLRFHFNKAGKLKVMNGNKIDIEKLNPNPTLSPTQAGEIALKQWQNIENSTMAIQPIVKNSTLYVYQKGLAQGYNGQKHLVYEIEITNENEVREFYFIDAQTGQIVDQVTGIHPIDRELYSGRLSANVLLWKEGDAFPGTLDVWQQNELVAAEHTYNLMKSAFNFTSFNNADGKMITTHNNPDIACPNANWNGVSANYCNGTASDDVVAHEWGHAYTEYTNNLIYAWQSGALNESYSDIWGEVVDLLNNYDDASENSNLLRTACGSSTRWLVGEKASAFGGAIRDMWNPTCKNHPGKVSDSQYICTTFDGGGVHINSGIQNHLFALLVDGGTYNGQTINALGLTKAAHIFWYAQRYFVGRTTNFAQQADNLEAALIALVGVNLPLLSTQSTTTSLSGITITLADAAELAKALLAVEMRNDPPCNFTALLKPVPEICSGGLTSNALYVEDFEDGLTGWSTTSTGGPNWELVTNPNNGNTTKVAFAVNQDGALPTGQIKSLTSPVINIPTATSVPLSLSFNHYVSLEEGYDGGNLKISINGGPFTLIPASAFLNNGYNGTLVSSGSDNPMKGQAAFTGADGGVTLGSWGESRINLTALGVDPGESISLKFDLGQDSFLGWLGWYIDNVKVYSCTQATVQFVVSSIDMLEAEGTTANTGTTACLPYVDKTFAIKINKAPTQPVTITFNTPTGTAKNGSALDYQLLTPTVTLSAENMTENATIRIYNDSYLEGNETVQLSYTLNANGGDAQTETNNQILTINIIDDEIAPGTFEVKPFSENFENRTDLTDWSFYMGESDDIDPSPGTYPTSWAIFTSPGILDPKGSKSLIADSDRSGRNFDWYKSVVSPTINTEGLTSLKLKFLENFRVYNGSSDLFDEYAKVDIWDGAAWQNVLTHLESAGNVGTRTAPILRVIDIPNQYANAGMKIRFTYRAKFDFWWNIDNIEVTANSKIKVQSAVNSMSPHIAYFGPSETILFTNPTDGNIMAKVTNLSAHDYGCTTAAIDRAGNGLIDWILGYSSTQKTLKITPTTQNPTGQYQITTYFTNAEVGAILPQILSMGKSPSGIPGAISGSFAELVARSAYLDDYQFSATFDSGFSGFGASNAPPVGPLAISLIDFSAKKTAAGNVVKWVTANETNNDRFILERSADSKNFNIIYETKGANNSTEKQEYSFLDQSNIGTVTYYRLKDVDNQGKMRTSKIISVSNTSNELLSISPNPSHDKVTIVNERGGTIQSYKVHNTYGQMIQQSIDKINRPSVELNIKDMAPGIYFVEIVTSLHKYTKKLIVK